MRILAGLLFCGGLLLATSFSEAQPPGQPPDKKGGKGDNGGKGGPGGGAKAMTVDELVSRMMTLDTNPITALSGKKAAFQNTAQLARSTNGPCWFLLKLSEDIG